MRRVGNARAIIPFAGERITAFDGGQGPHRRHAMRSGKMSIGPEEVSLAPFGPVRRDQKWMRGAKRQAPSRRRMAVSDFEHRPVKGRNVEFITAEHAWLYRAVETGFDECFVQLGRIRAAFVILGLLRAQQRLERGGAGGQFLWGLIAL